MKLFEEMENKFTSASSATLKAYINNNTFKTCFEGQIVTRVHLQDFYTTYSSLIP